MNVKFKKIHAVALALLERRHAPAGLGYSETMAEIFEGPPEFVDLVVVGEM